MKENYQKNYQKICRTLGIKYTEDYGVIKKSYLHKAKELHPDKNLGNEQKAVKAFQEFFNNWLEFDTFYQNFINPSPKREPEAESKTSNPRKPGSEESSTSELKPYLNEYVSVFLPIFYIPSSDLAHIDPEISKATSKATSKIIQLGGIILEPASKEKPVFDTEQLLKAINSNLKCAQQVGMTHEEATEIANQHSHYHPHLIVELKVPITRLDERASEEKRFDSNVLNAKSGEYFWLAENTHISQEMLISMRDCPARTRKFRVQTEEYWKKGLKISFNLMLEEPPAKRIETIGSSQSGEIASDNNLIGAPAPTVSVADNNVSTPKPIMVKAALVLPPKPQAKKPSLPNPPSEAETVTPPRVVTFIEANKENPARSQTGRFFSRVGNFMAKYPGTSAFLIGLALVGAGIGLWYLLPVVLAAAGFVTAAASILPAASIFSVVGWAIASVFGATTLSSAAALGLGTAATAFAGGLGLGVVVGIGELFITPKNSGVLTAQDNRPSVEGRKRKNGKEKAIGEETQWSTSQNNDSKPVNPVSDPNNGETSSRSSGNGSRFFPHAQQSNDGSDTSPEESDFGHEPRSSSLGSSLSYN